MKELMVTLLVLSCTGMVWAQQNDSNGFRTRGSTSSGSGTNPSADGEPPVVPIVSEGSSASARRPLTSLPLSRSTGSSSPINRSPLGTSPLGNSAQGTQNIGRTIGRSTDRNGFETRSDSPFSTARSRQSSSETPTILNPSRRVQDSFSARPTDASSGNTIRTSATNSPERLAVPTEAMDILLRSGTIIAGVSNPDADRVTISDRKALKGGQSRPIRGSLRGDSLVFTVTQSDLQFIREGSLYYEVPEFVKGKYRTATLEYPPALNQLSQTNAAQRTNPGFQADDGRWRLAGAGDVPGRLPTQRIEPVQNNSPWDNANNNQFAELERQQQQRAEYDRWLKEKESRERLELADENRQLQDQLARLRWNQQQDLLAQTQQQNLLGRTQQQVLAQTQPPTPYPAPRYADNSFNPLTQQIVAQPVLRQPVVAQPVVTQPIVTRPVVAPVATEPLGYSVVQAQMQQMETRMAQLQRENIQLSNDVRNVRAEHNEDVRRQLFDIGSDRRNEVVQSQSRTTGYEIDRRRLDDDKPLQGRTVLSTGTFGNDRGRSKANNGGEFPEKSSNQGKSSWVLMFLLLLISVGINLYLFALSRGLYMRYQELADELRDTFTVTA